MAGALVGQALLTASIQVLCDRIASRDFIDLFRRKKLDDSLLKKLKITLLALSAVLNDAEEKQIVNPAVKDWLDELKHAIFDADDLLDEINTEALRCKVEAAEYDQTHKVTKVWNFLSPFNPSCQGMNAKIVEVFERLEHLAKQKSVLGLTEVVGGNKVSQRPPTTSLVDESSVYGRDEDKEKLAKLLFSDDASSNDVSVIPIVGMGGVGKTTLAQLLYNDDKVKEYFSLKAWACVSEDFDVLSITKTLLQSVTSKPCDNIMDLNLLQVQLREEVRGKKILFVLDDLWNENYDDWNLLHAPFTLVAKGSKVIITTRNKNVAAVMNNVPIHYLEQLSDEYCWSLLSKHALGNENPSEYANLVEIGKRIARNCNGLPLAAKTLGGLLRCKRESKEWNSILHSNIWELPQNKSNILPALKLSYHYLPTQLKQCFVYCSIFPKDYEFEKKDVVLLWVAEGLIPQVENEIGMEEVAEEYFDELVSRSLFQKSRSRFTMHDLINDLATFVAKGFCFRLEGLESHEAHKTVRHFSYIRGDFDIAHRFDPLYGVKCLRTFLPLTSFHWPNYISKRVSHDFLLALGCLRVLSLSKYTNIVELPNSIGNLIHMRYLDLSSTAIKRLPDTVCSLCNLQTLLLLNCSSLIELPADMRKLINLRHLDIRGTNIQEMPFQMGRLKSLKTLSSFVVGNSSGSRLRELRELPHLWGNFSILKLQNVVNAMDALQANLKEKKDLKEIVLEWGKDTNDPQNERDVLERLQPPINLENLTIKFYGGTCFPNWLGDSSFSQIQFLCLSECSYCLSLPPLGQLPALKNLSIKGMKFLTTNGAEFYGNMSSLTQPFQSLEKLVFEEMLEWEEWLPSGGQCSDFPRLQELILKNCPKLRGNLPNHLPCLKKLSVKKCMVLYERGTTTLNMDYLKQSLKELTVDGCPGLLSLLDQRTEFMPSIQRLYIQNFGDIECLPKQMVHSSSNFLQYMGLYDCPSLLSFPIDGLPTTLRELEIRNCRRLEFLPHEIMAKLTLLCNLRIENSCDSLRSFWLGIFPKLSHLSIRGCVNLESLSIEGVDENLSYLQIWECPNLVSFPHGGLCTPNLNEFSVRRCKNLKSLPERIQTLTALQGLYIENLPNVVSIAEGGLPPNLRSFAVYDCDRLRPSAEWGLQGLQTLEIGGSDDLLETLLKEQLLPTTLNNLYISGHSLKSLNGLQHLTSLQRLEIDRCASLELLPGEALQHLTSLQRLEIGYCLSLELLPGEALQHLTSLQRLEIEFCPSLKFLPGEGLPASLTFLSVKRCSSLKKWYCEKKIGKDWAKIARIPCIKIDDEVII